MPAPMATQLVATVGPTEYPEIEVVRTLRVLGSRCMILAYTLHPLNPSGMEVSQG